MIRYKTQILTNLSIAKKLLRESVVVDVNIVRTTSGLITIIFMIGSFGLLCRYLYVRYVKFRESWNRMERGKTRQGSPVPISCRLTGTEKIKLGKLSGAQEGDGEATSSSRG